MEAERSYHHTDLKSELIREGLRILDAEGYDGLTLRKVAKACHVSQTAPYRHFTNKDELIGAITLQAMQLFNQALQGAVDSYPDDAAMQLKVMGVAYIRFFRDNPEYLRLLFFSRIREKVDQKALEAWDNVYHDNYRDNHPYNTLYQAVARYKASNPGEKMTQDELALLCWGVVHGLATLLSSGDLGDETQSMKSIEGLILGEHFLM